MTDDATDDGLELFLRTLEKSHEELQLGFARAAAVRDSVGYPGKHTLSARVQFLEDTTSVLAEMQSRNLEMARLIAQALLEEHNGTTDRGTKVVEILQRLGQRNLDPV